MSKIETIKEIITPIAIQYGLKRIYLFGSYAKGTANENSDIDLLIEKGKPLSLLKLSGFRQDVEAAMNLSDDHPMKITEYAVKEFSDLRVSDNGNIMVFQVLYYVKPANFHKYHEAGSTIKFGEDQGKWAYWASHYTSVAMVRIENSDKWAKVFSGGSIEFNYVESYYAAY